MKKLLLLLLSVALLTSCSKSKSVSKSQDTTKLYRVRMLNVRDAIFNAKSIEQSFNDKGALDDYYKPGDTVFVNYNNYTLSDRMTSSQVVVIRRLN